MEENKQTLINGGLQKNPLTELNEQDIIRLNTAMREFIPKLYTKQDKKRYEETRIKLMGML